jgi:hypothetical protein
MNVTAFQKVLWPALGITALLLAGCPYGSEYPLGSPADAVADGALLGTWITPQASDEDFTLTIRTSGAGEYLLEAESPDEEEPESFRAFVSTVDGEKFLNIQDEEWILVNYRVSGDLLQLRLVDDELFESRTFASPEDLRDFVRQNLADPRLYGGEKEGDWDWELERGGPGT